MLIGDLEGPTARIDRAGTITSLDAAWKIEWGVGGDDRWRLAHDERAVRQDRIDDTPVSETWLRVPGGEVIQRVAAVNDGGGRAILIEFENASSASVVVAVVAGVVGLVEASVDEVMVDGSPWMRGSRSAGGIVAVEGDPWAAVRAEPPAESVTIDAGDVGTALLLALPHRQSVKVVIGVVGDLPSPMVDPAEVAAGWRGVTSSALEIDVPDPALVAAWRRVVCDLVLAAGSDIPIAVAEAAWWLDRAGLHREADRARVKVVAAALDHSLTGEAATAALRALASRELHTGNPSGLDELAGPLAAAAGESLDQTTVSLVAAALEPRSPQAAADARGLADTLTLADWTGATRVADGAARVINTIVADPIVGGMDADGPIALLPDVPDEWLGQPVDVRGLVTRAGTISFSVRWHGDRPAVLWERTGGPPDDVVEITFPDLDAGWSSRQVSGEALLAAPVRA